MNFLFWVIFGALTGWATSKLLGQSKNQGLISDIILGIVGAFVGGFIMEFFGKSGVTGFNLYSFVVAILGSTVVVVIKRKLLG